MTNEEKALELSSMNKYGFSVEESNAAYNAALTMAKWKDAQYEDERKELRGLVNMLPIDDRNQTIIEDLKGLLR